MLETYSKARRPTRVCESMVLAPPAFKTWKMTTWESTNYHRSPLSFHVTKVETRSKMDKGKENKDRRNFETNESAQWKERAATKGDWTEGM